jgi:hypothetical protein
LKRFHTVIERGGDESEVNLDEANNNLNHSPGISNEASVKNPGDADVDSVPDEHTSQELGFMDWSSATALPDQAWWLDFDFDANVLDVDTSLFEPYTVEQTEPLHPYDRVLPDGEMQKLWFSCIPETESLTDRHDPGLQSMVAFSSRRELHRVAQSIMLS